MATKTLYRKYRSKDFSEIIGQEHITNVLSQSIEKNKISHAYLFTGPRGVGKTSVARIFAREVNQLAHENDSHIDIIEIDAASNRRIDEIRELREKVHVSPIELKYKVYIIDEVHMLTKEAFNALLKTLEEPPEHCIFILATTEAHKLPETIISRTQRHNFQLINAVLIEKHLRAIAKKEKIDIDDEALALLADHSGGSFRDAISLLDQFSGHNEKVTQALAASTLGLAEKQTIEALLGSLDKNDKEKLLKTLDNILKSGVNSQNLANQIVRFLLKKNHKETINYNHLKLCDELLEVTSSTHPEIKLEIALLKSLKSKPPESNESFKLRVTNPAIKISSSSQKLRDANKNKSESNAEQNKKADQPIQSEATANQKMQSINEEAANKILQAIKISNSALYGVMRVANLKLKDDKVVVEFKFAFHGRRASDKKNKMIITDCIKEVVAGVNEVEIIVNNHLEKTEPKADMVNDPAKSIIDTFGGGEIINYG